VTAIAGRRADARTVEVFSIKGAQNAIIMPDQWNGDLFVYAHGYSADKRILAPIPADLVGANAGVRRVTADADAVRFMRRFFEPRGRTRAKVITVHALDDGLVLPENEDKYREAFAAARNEDRLVQLFTATGGHCIFIPAWTPALRALQAWVAQGTKPTTASVSAACGECLTSDVPGPWGLRIVERRARGVALRSLVCDGEPGDCPANATCVASTHRCK
jgi:hypothetical protein